MHLKYSYHSNSLGGNPMFLCVKSLSLKSFKKIFQTKKRLGKNEFVQIARLNLHSFNIPWCDAEKRLRSK